MKNLHNTVDSRILKEQVKQSDEQRITISFYQYHHIQNPQLFRDHVYVIWDNLKVFGRIYVSYEGVNAQISVPEENLEAFKNSLEEIDFLKGIRLNIAREDDGKSFFKLKIKVREKIVADGLDDSTFDVTDKGKHLSAQEFNEIIAKEDTVLVDMRNHYESEIGHFKGAITPDVDSFREELPYVEDLLKDQKDKHLVMYCTGGIRCEKASAYMKHKGFQNVYQLEGGIIEYARQVEEQDLENKFIGKNFVFDDRRAESIGHEVIAQCHQCGAPCDTHVNCVNDACHLLFIQCDDCKEKMEGCCSTSCQETIHLPEEEQRALRKGQVKSNYIFKKGRSEALTFKK